MEPGRFCIGMCRCTQIVAGHAREDRNVDALPETHRRVVPIENDGFDNDKLCRRLSDRGHHPGFPKSEKCQSERCPKRCQAWEGSGMGRSLPQQYPGFGMAIPCAYRSQRSDLIL